MFKLPKDAKTWFSEINDAVSLDFDLYYFCLMAGLSKPQKETLQANDTTDIINRFPKEYSAESKIITSLFLKRELDSLGISLQDRKSVHEAIRGYINYSDPTGFSEEGQKEINRYVNGGLEVLKEYFEDKPRTIEAFLLRFTQMIDEYAESSCNSAMFIKEGPENEYKA